MKFVGHIYDEDLLKIFKSVGLFTKEEMAEALEAVKQGQKHVLREAVEAIKREKENENLTVHSTSQSVGEQTFRFQEGVNYDWDEMQCLAQFFPKESYRLSEPSDFRHSSWGVRMLQTVEIKVDVTLLGD